MNIGCHVSIAGGIKNAPERASDLGCEVMQIFTRSPQGGKAVVLTEEICQEFKNKTSEFQIKETYIHAPYYINLASENNRIRYGSMKVIREELERASAIGSKYVMTHLGSAGILSEREASEKIVKMLTKSLDGYDGSAELLIENSAGTGKIIGDSFSEIAYIISAINHPKLSGICLDTQHSWASGYDWHDWEKTIQRIDSEIGIEKIKLIHANDSKTELSSAKDRHQHIGKGLIGEESFKKIVSFAKQNKISLILETEHDFVKEDIQLLKQIQQKI